jgi:hypothetical protein
MPVALLGRPGCIGNLPMMGSMHFQKRRLWANMMMNDAFQMDISTKRPAIENSAQEEAMCSVWPRRHPVRLGSTQKDGGV